MQETVKSLCNDHENLRHGLKVLNVGFGLGIVRPGSLSHTVIWLNKSQIDTFFQQLPVKPVQHVIIEPHPDVLRHMKELGWYEKPGVKILEGKWQDFINSDELLGVGGFDVIYTDTFSEDYKGQYPSVPSVDSSVLTITLDLHEFFGSVPDLLAGPESRFSFFHGLGATSEQCIGISCCFATSY